MPINQKVITAYIDDIRQNNRPHTYCRAPYSVKVLFERIEGHEE